MDRKPDENNKQIALADPWLELKPYTSARIALGRAGGSITTKEWLDFKLAHAKARDAVHCEFDSDSLLKEFAKLGGAKHGESVLLVKTQVKTREEYLKRPDLGRGLDAESITTLKKNNQSTDVVFIVSDGLSATAVHDHANNLLKSLLPKLRESLWSIAPIVVARFGRVALQDEIGHLIGAKAAVILIGERPGLGSPDSLGAYLVYNPKADNTDANRNCVSNIRPAGLNYEKAADTIFYLLSEMNRRKLSGVAVKDNRTNNHINEYKYE